MTHPRPVLAGICCAALAVSGSASVQTSVQQETGWGLHTARFDTLQGRVVVYLPDGLAAGDTISGTVVAEPRESGTAGPGELGLDLAGTALPAEGGAFRWVIPAGVGGGAALLRVLDEDGGVLASASVPARTSAPPPPTELGLPTLGQVGRPVTIHGPFDGDLATTAVTVGGQPSAVLAESPRKAVAGLPPGVEGPVEITVKEGAISGRGQIRVLGVSLFAPKLDLRSGERTTLRVTVSGLQGLGEEVSMRVVNRSPSRVSMAGGDDQGVTIAPSEVDESGRFTWATGLEGLSPGGFEISAIVAGLDRPEAPQAARADADATRLLGDEPSRQEPAGQPEPEPATEPEPEPEPEEEPEPKPETRPEDQGDPKPPPPPPPSHPIAGRPDVICCCPRTLELVPDFKEEVLPLRGGLRISDHVTHNGDVVWAGDYQVGRAENESASTPGWMNLTFKFQVVAEVEWVDGQARLPRGDCSFTQEIQRIDDPNPKAAWPAPRDDFRRNGWEPDAPAGQVVTVRGQRREGVRRSFSSGGAIYYSWADPFQLHYDPDEVAFLPFKKGRFTWYIESGCRPADCEHAEIERLGTVTLSAYAGAEKVCTFEEGHH